MSALELIEGLRKADAKSTPDYFEFEDGSILWNASLVLLNYLCEHQGALKGKRVLELGSGLGHLAVGLCRVGAHVTCTELPSLVPELQASVAKQLVGHEPLGTIEAIELEWGEEAFSRSPLSREDAPKFDVIVLAEVVYNTSFHEMLLWTINKFAHPDIVIYSVLLDRPFSFLFFGQLADVGRYEVEPIKDFDPLGVDEELLSMHRITMTKGT